MEGAGGHSCPPCPAGLRAANGAGGSRGCRVGCWLSRSLSGAAGAQWAPASGRRAIVDADPTVIRTPSTHLQSARCLGAKPEAIGDMTASVGGEGPP